LFIVFAVFFATKNSPFPHFFTVTAQKSEIKPKLQTSITQAENMFAAYELYAADRESLYESTLNSVIRSGNSDRIESYGFQNISISYDKQIETKMRTLHFDLFPPNYSDTKEVATEWLQYAKKTTSSCKPIGIVSVVNDIKKNSTDWCNTLVTLSQVREQGEKDSNTDDFKYPLSIEDVKTHFTKLDSPTALSIGLAVFAYVLMLLSWFVTKRSTRFPGLKFLFGFGKSSDNEL
jgi:hypothetical protein